jgi:hypothetical protein
MKKILYISSILLIYTYTSCNISSDILNNTQNNHLINNANNDTVYFYLSDTVGNMQTKFELEEDIIFNFGVINNSDTNMTFTKVHGGTSIVSFYVFKGDSLFGISDEDYVYTAIIVGGAIFPHDTLEYSESWYSNPYHQNKFETGKYYTTIHPYIWFDNFNLNCYLDTVYFEIVKNNSN